MGECKYFNCRRHFVITQNCSGNVWKFSEGRDEKVLYRDVGGINLLTPSLTYECMMFFRIPFNVFEDPVLKSS